MPIREQDGQLVISLHIQPRASRTEVQGLHDGAIRLRVAAPPVDGKANAEIVKFLSKRLGVKKGDVEILTGETSRRKVVAVSGISLAEASRLLGEESGSRSG